MDSSRNRTIAALERVFDYLEHEARGHLSVLSNDIAYWRLFLPDGETERARRKIAELCALFSLRERLTQICKDGESSAGEGSDLYRVVLRLLPEGAGRFVEEREEE
jgi:hypothetical protein